MITSDTDAPEFLGIKFVAAVRQKRRRIFRDLLMENEFLWGVYFFSITPEEQVWAAANRPDHRDPEFQRSRVA